MDFKIGDIVRLKTGTAPQVVVSVGINDIIAKYLDPNWYERSCEYLKINQEKNFLEFDLDIILANYKTIPRSYKDYSLYECVTEPRNNLFEILQDKVNNYVSFTYCGRTLYSCNNTQKQDYNSNQDTNFNNANSEKGETTMTNKLYQVIGQDLYGTYLATNSKKEIVLEMRDGSNTLRAFKEEDLEEVKPWTFDVKWQDECTISYSGEKDSVSVGDILISGYGNKLKFGMVVKINSKKDIAKEFQGLKLTGVEDFHSGKKNKDVDAEKDAENEK